MHGLVTLPFADGEYAFRLTLGGIARIEEKFDKSIFVIVANLQLKTAKSAEIFEVIKEGLVGGDGKVTHVEANRLMVRYGDERALLEHCALAYQIGLAGVMRVHSRELADPPGEPAAPESPSGSTSAPSSDQPS